MKIGSISSVIAVAVATLLVFASPVHGQGRSGTRAVRGSHARAFNGGSFRGAGQFRGASVRGRYGRYGWYGRGYGYGRGWGRYGYGGVYGFPYFGWGYPYWYPPYGYYPYPPPYGYGPGVDDSNRPAHVYESHPVNPDYGK